MIATTPVLRGVRVQGAAKVSAAATPGEDFSIDAGGASTAEIQAIEADHLAIHANGGSTVTAKGRAKEVRIAAGGASTVEAGGTNVEAGGLDADSVEIQASGASRIVIRATESLTGQASGASFVEVSGEPKVREVKASGGSNVQYEK